MRSSCESYEAIGVGGLYLTPHCILSLVKVIDVIVSQWGGEGLSAGNAEGAFSDVLEAYAVSRSEVGMTIGGLCVMSVMHHVSVEECSLLFCGEGSPHEH